MSPHPVVRVVVMVSAIAKVVSVVVQRMSASFRQVTDCHRNGRSNWNETKLTLLHQQLKGHRRNAITVSFDL